MDMKCNEISGFRALSATLKNRWLSACRCGFSRGLSFCEMDITQRISLLKQSIVEHCAEGAKGAQHVIEVVNKVKEANKGERGEGVARSYLAPLSIEVVGTHGCYVQTCRWSWIRMWRSLSRSTCST